MQTKIIHLDSFDDINSIKDKMAWGKNAQILLVLPVKENILRGQLDLKLIQRHAEKLSSPIILVSNKQSIVEFATQLNIPIYISIRKAQKAITSTISQIQDKSLSNHFSDQSKSNFDEKRGRINNIRNVLQNRDLLTKRYISLAVGVISFLLIVAIILPSAEITLQPKTTNQSLPITLHIRPGLINYTLSGAIPTKSFTTVVEGQKEISATGELIYPLDKATGTIDVTNLTDQEFTIPTNQVVTTLGDGQIKYSTTEEIKLLGIPGEIITVPVQAINPGHSGNIGPNLISIMEGEYSLVVSVTNSKTISGGTQRVSKGPSDFDYDQLLNELSESLKKSALSEIESQLEEGDIILEIFPSAIQIELQEFLPISPQPSNTLRLQLQLSYTAQVVSHQTIIDLGNQLLNASLKNGFSAVNSSVKYTFNNDPFFNENQDVLWDIIFTHEVYKTLNENALQYQISGMKITDLSKYLSENIVLQTSPIISVNPTWWPFVPISPLNIKINYEN